MIAIILRILVSYGIAGYVNEMEMDPDTLSEFYSDESNLLVLSLFGARFFEGLNTEYELTIVRNTAVSLITYIIKQDKNISNLFNEKDYSEYLINCKNNWLQSIGVSYRYKNPYESLLQKFKFIQNDLEKPILVFDNYNFYLDKIIYQQYYTENMNEFEKAFCMICDRQVQLKKLIIEAADPSIFELLNLEKPVNCYFIKPGNTSGTTSNNILLSNIASFNHESIHDMFWKSNGGKEYVWLREGIATYLGEVKNNNYTALFLWKDYNDAKEKIDLLSNKYVDYKKYFEMGGSMKNATEVDVSKFYRAVVYALNFNKEYELLCRRSRSLEKVNNIDLPEEIEDWTYEESEQFVEYLVNKYTLKKILKVVMKFDTLEKELGKDLEELHQEWRQYFLKENNH